MTGSDEPRQSAKLRLDDSRALGERASATVRVGIVGAGPMGRLHARTVSKIAALDGTCVLESVMDRHAGRAEAVAAEFGSQAFTDLGEAISKIDAVIVCGPTSTHHSLTSWLLKRGLDVLVEKPLAATIAEAKQLAVQANTYDRILQVGHVEWYNTGWREAARLAGSPETIEVERLNPDSDRGLDMDVVQDLMLHDLDWVARYLDDEVVEVKAQGRCMHHSGLDEAEAELLFRSGCRVRLRASRVFPDCRRIVRISGSQGSAVADLLTRRVEGAPASSISSPDPLQAQWRDFLTSIHERKTPNADALVGVAALELVERVREAIEGWGP
jgi:predicted dehydrogenase